MEVFHQLDTREDDNLCKLVGIDIEQKIRELVASIERSPSVAQPHKETEEHQKFDLSNLETSNH